MDRNEKGQFLPEGEQAKKKMITVKVTEDLFIEIKQAAKNNGITVSDLVILGVELALEQLAQNEQTEPQKEPDLTQPVSTPPKKQPKKLLQQSDIEYLPLLSGKCQEMDSWQREKALEAERGMTNQELSDRTGIPVSTLEKWKIKLNRREKIVSTKYQVIADKVKLADSLWILKDT